MGLLKWFLGEEPGLIERIANYENKGQFGEYLTKYALSNNNITGYSKILCNVYLPYRGKTSEIDVIMIHEKGIYIFESKNYSGWIFGSADQKNWTQCIKGGKKFQFYNPILQNKTHINAISNFLNLPKEEFKSYILFSDHCELKKVPNNCEEYIVINREKLLKNIRSELKNRKIIYSQEQVNNFYNLLFPLTQVSEEEKKKHIENIKNKP